MAIGSPQWMYASGEDFTLDQSLRFNDGDSAYLSRTPTGAGNRKTFTFSGWVKRGAISVQQTLMSVNNGSDNSTILHIYLASDDEITISFQAFTLTTTPLLRDTSAWYHIMFVADTTQALEANRFKIYLNGTQLTLGSSGTFIAQDTDLAFNQATEHCIGRRDNDNDRYFDGYLSEFHFIDGTALTPSSFGETGDYGEWKPIEVSGLTYGTNGFYLSFAGGGIVAATGGTITTDGDYKVHTFTSNGTFTPTTVPTGGGYAEYLIVAGGGGGGVGYLYNIISGGGGAGGYLTGYIPISAQGYSITVGAGGAGGNPDVSLSANGSNSTGFGLTAVGGGAGRKYNSQGEDGGSGGGTGLRSSGTDMTGGDGTSGQGYDGGSGTEFGGTGTANSGGGGGGASAAGGNGSGGTGGAGGNGKASSISGGSVTYAGGGGGGGRSSGGAGGSGGGGAGHGGDGAGANATGYGSGGGGGTASTGSQYTGGNGSAGIVIVRYKFQ